MAPSDNVAVQRSDDGYPPHRLLTSKPSRPRLCFSSPKAPALRRCSRPVVPAPMALPSPSPRALGLMSFVLVATQNKILGGATP
jgi:hypothetical protein